MSADKKHGSLGQKCDEDVHPIFKTDPMQSKEHVYKEVEITTDGGKTCRGWVYTVDPVSGSFVLVTFETGHPIVEVVLGHTVKEVTVVNENLNMYKSQLEHLLQHDQKIVTLHDLQERKKRVKLWLQCNRLPVSESETGDELCIQDAVVIYPPYEPEHCISTNEVILWKLQKLIQSMPKDIPDPASMSFSSLPRVRSSMEENEKQ